MGGRGRMGGGQADCGGRTGGQEANGRTGGCGAKERRTGGQLGEWRRTGGRANMWMRVDGGRTGRTSGRADGWTSRGFKRPRTLFPASLLSTQTTRLIVERVCRALGSALGSQPGLCYSFLLRTTYLQSTHNTIVKCVPELFWHCLEL